MCLDLLEDQQTEANFEWLRKKITQKFNTFRSSNSPSKNVDIVSNYESPNDDSKDSIVFTSGKNKFIGHKSLHDEGIYGGDAFKLFKKNEMKLRRPPLPFRIG